MKKDKHNLKKNTAQKTKHRATRTTLKKRRGELRSTYIFTVLFLIKYVIIFTKNIFWCLNYNSNNFTFILNINHTDSVTTLCFLFPL